MSCAVFPSSIELPAIGFRLQMRFDPLPCQRFQSESRNDVQVGVVLTLRNSRNVAATSDSVRSDKVSRCATGMMTPECFSAP